MQDGFRHYPTDPTRAFIFRGSFPPRAQRSLLCDFLGIRLSINPNSLTPRQGGASPTLFHTYTRPLSLATCLTRLAFLSDTTFLILLWFQIAHWRL